jgi:superfamily I DNA/RNA helicase
VEVKPARVWSAAQHAIFNWFEEDWNAWKYGNGNLIVRARAGTGKTTTIIEGVNRAPEASILLCAFNKRIADELTARLDNPRAEAKTLHSLGLSLLRREWRGMPVNEVKKHKVYRSDVLTDTAFKATGHSDVPYPIRRMVTTLHTKAREMCPLEATSDALTALAFQFDQVPEGWQVYDLEFVVTHALLAMHEAATVPPAYDIGVDYADMVFLPLVWDLTSKDYDLVVVDEAQDMSLAQLELAERVCGGRICVCGDDRQSVYSFRGCDSSALDRLKKKLGALELPLNTTYRCGTEIVKYAQRLVPDIQAGPDNPPGIVDSCTPAELLTLVKPGDFVLSRLNAPLVSITLRLLRNGVRATMAGRDIGAGVVAILQKLKVKSDYTPLPQVKLLVEGWERSKVSKLAAMGLAEDIDRIRDQADVLYAFIADAGTTKEMFNKLDTLFTNVDGEPIAGSVLCSSIHKAKGCETDRVFLLMDTLYRRGNTPEESNLEYVGCTRAKSHLTLVRA